MSTKQANSYNPSHSLLSLFPFPHLMPHHLTDNGRTEVTLLIASIEPQEVEVEPGHFEEKPVITFEKTELGFVLHGRHDLQTLTDIYDVNSIGAASGKTITIALIDDKENGSLMIVPPTVTKKGATKSSNKDDPGDADTEPAQKAQEPATEE